tara:strand:+ start:523 stop:1377 length:855 start_codon:yes stop_codon:yes gene_type:complete
MRDTLFILFQYFIPQHFISKIVSKFAASKNRSIKNAFIALYLKRFDIKMNEALIEDPFDYESFNDFFTRELKPELRPVDQGDKSIISPCDSLISQCGPITDNRVIQAKSRFFHLNDLLGFKKSTNSVFQNGTFLTFYLAPKDYHRIHMPYSGKLKSMIYIPGDLFSVNTVTANSVDNLFSRNERLVCIFETSYGPMAMVLVGAIIVSGIRVIWKKDGFNEIKQIKKWDFSSELDNEIFLEKGEEMGHFMLGSTVIVCFPDSSMSLDESISKNSVIQMGEMIGSY